MLWMRTERPPYRTYTGIQQWLVVTNIKIRQLTTTLNSHCSVCTEACECWIIKGHLNYPKLKMKQWKGMKFTCVNYRGSTNFTLSFRQCQCDHKCSLYEGIKLIVHPTACVCAKSLIWQVNLGQRLKTRDIINKIRPWFTGIKYLYFWSCTAGSWMVLLLLYSYTFKYIYIYCRVYGVFRQEGLHVLLYILDLIDMFSFITSLLYSCFY